MSKNVLKFIIPFLIVFLVGLFLGSKGFIFKNSSSSNDVPTDCKSGYGLLNSFIACDFSEEKNLEMVKILDSKIDELIDSSLKDKKATEISIFFRDLTSKKWVGKNQNENYAPASLLKLPLLIAYFKLKEIQPDIFLEKFVFDNKYSGKIVQNIKPDIRLEQNKEYTVEELLYHMIVYSDNDALDLLGASIDQNFITKVFNDLGISIPIDDSDTKILISPQIYAGIFRLLYNSSYLTRQSSEDILELLSKTRFKDGLMAGFPSEIIVSHKFGERKIIDKSTSSEINELHDCGIIYYPEHPYILCVMTIGDNFDNLKEIIKKTSALVYEEFDKINKK
jgi:beta-lactamase class A